MSCTEKMILKIVEEILPDAPGNGAMTTPESRFFNALMEKVGLYVPDELRAAVERCFYVVILEIEKDKKSQRHAELFILSVGNLIKRYRNGWI